MLPPNEVKNIYQRSTSVGLKQPMSIKATLKRVVDDLDSREGLVFAWLIQSLIILSLVTFSIETLPDLSESTRQLLHAIEAGTVAVFTVEYLVRLYLAERRLAYIFSFYGLVDLIAIAPFYIAAGVDLRSVRLLWALRLLRVLKLVRYSKAIGRFHRALAIVREELILFTVVAAVFLYLAAVGIYYFEHEAQPDDFRSIFHSLWWALSTLTTVGYGDIYPITLGGRIFTFFVLAIGLGIVAVPTGLVASALAQARREELDAVTRSKRRKKQK